VSHRRLARHRLEAVVAARTASGRGTNHQHKLAQWVEQEMVILPVAGSTPVLVTSCQLVLETTMSGACSASRQPGDPRMKVDRSAPGAMNRRIARREIRGAVREPTRLRHAIHALSHGDGAAPPADRDGGVGEPRPIDDAVAGMGPRRRGGKK
jgi:hypothetical protein